MMRRFRRIVLTAVLPAILVSAPGCRRESPTPRLKGGGSVNLLLVTVDAVRADRLGVFGSAAAPTPHIDRLAAEGAAFRNCYAPAPQTLPSHATIFTGREPPAHGVRVDGGDGLPARERTWAEMMKAAAFETFALVSSYRLHSRFGLNQGFDLYDDALDYSQILNSPVTAVAAEKVLIRFRSWLEGRNPERSFFAWVHFSDLRPSALQFPELSRPSGHDPYGTMVGRVDSAVGEIMGLLESGNLASRTVVVLAGSHGVRLHEKREAGHGLFSYEEMIKVPLIIRLPGTVLETRRTDRRVRLLDLLPSMLELLGLEIPDGLHGQSVWPLLSPRRSKTETERAVYFESRQGTEDMALFPLAGLIEGPYKLLSLPRDEMYDLGKDPAETRNLALEEKERAAALKGRLRAYLDRLGGEGQTGHDPRPGEGIDSVGRLMAAERLIAEEKTEEAEKELRDILRTFPDAKLPLAYDLLLLIARKSGDPGKTEEVLRRAAAAYPDIGRFSIALAQSLAASRHLDEAERICREALDRNPRLSQALILLGNIAGKRGEPGRAVSLLEKALDIEPLNRALQLEYAFQLTEHGDKARALEVLEKMIKDPALAADPSGVPLRSDIAGLLIKAGEKEMAHALLLDMAAQDRGDGKIWTQIGMVYVEKGDIPKARESLEKALSLEPGNALALSAMGTVHLAVFRGQGRRADLESAIDYYIKAKEAEPRLVAAWNGLGVAWRYSGDTVKAIDSWRHALRLDPGFTNTYFNLGITLLESGRRAEARQVLSQCLEIHADKLSEGEKRQLRTLLAEASQ
ncbi:MAG: sulfatase-like hydrolase/transferase [Candidatus Aminicenantales bacterium]